MGNDDVLWFRQRVERQARIRTPAPGEFDASWRYLGMHEANRRRVLVWRVPRDNPGRSKVPDGLMRVPFLAFADETIEDSDAVVLAILKQIMAEAAAIESRNGFIRTGGGVVGVA